MTPGTVWFIGAGPGDPELLTMKGYRLIAQADLVLYAGSLVPPAVVAHAKPGARVIDSAPLSLEETHALLRDTAKAGGLAARVHTGDPSLYGAMREQMALLDAEGIAYAVVPGVTAAFAAAAAAKVSVTVPERVQSFSITRIGGRTPVPPGQTIKDLARHGGSLAVYLSAPDAAEVQQDLLDAGLAGETPVIMAHRVGWPEERLVWTTVACLAQAAQEAAFTRQTVFLVLPGEQAGAHTVSRLYAASFGHGFRDQKGTS